MSQSSLGFSFWPANKPKLHKLACSCEDMVNETGITTCCSLALPKVTASCCYFTSNHTGFRAEWSWHSLWLLCLSPTPPPVLINPSDWVSVLWLIIVPALGNRLFGITLYSATDSQQELSYIIPFIITAAFLSSKSANKNSTPQQDKNPEISFHLGKHSAKSSDLNTLYNDSDFVKKK